MRYYHRARFKIYPREIFDILVALAVLIFSLSVIMGGGIEHFTSYLIVSSLAVITGFFLHEMSHKYMAFRYGFPAAFQAWYIGLGIALFSAFMGFLFAAPGAVMVYGYPSKRENGIISAAGPSTNIILGFSLLAAGYLFPQFSFALWYVAYFNFFLAFFNLLPIPPMDGTKIIPWNIKAYILLMVGSITGIALFYI